MALEQRVLAEQPGDELGHPLAQVGREQLGNRRFGSGLLTLEALGEAAQAVVLLGGRFDRELRDLLADVVVLDAGPAIYIHGLGDLDELMEQLFGAAERLAD